MKPGSRYVPRASTTCAAAGGCTRARGPTAAMRAPVTTTVASASGAPPLPSMTVAPTNAMERSGGAAWAAARAAGSVRARQARRALALMGPSELLALEDLLLQAGQVVVHLLGAREDLH